MTTDAYALVASDDPLAPRLAPRLHEVARTIDRVAAESPGLPIDTLARRFETIGFVKARTVRRVMRAMASAGRIEVRHEWRGTPRRRHALIFPASPKGRSGTCANDATVAT